METSVPASKPERLNFFGKDSDECEIFIADVMMHAYDEGKQKDDDWIADFVGTCLRQNALRWWTGLDEATQGSWKLLRKALFIKYSPVTVFCGESGEEAEKFVFSIRQRAHDVGKLEDPQWIATFSAVFFAGNALRWYSSLQINVQKDWDALQRAIFIQYPRETKDGDISSILPTPPFATAIGAVFTAPRRGRIKLTRNGDSQTYYLSRNLHQGGYPLVQASKDNALEVEYREDDLTEPQTLYIPDSQFASYDILGIRYSTTDPVTSTEARLCPIDSSSGAVSWNVYSSGASIQDAWKISSKPEGDATLSVMRGSAIMYAYTSGKGATIGFSVGQRSSDAASVFFEPI